MERIEDRVFKRFNEIFEDQLSRFNRRKDQFEVAQEQFREQCGFHAYASYESFKTARCARNRRRSTRR